VYFRAAARGLLVMLDSHVNDPNAGIPELWSVRVSIFLDIPSFKYS
jgi:hypothetical protein